MTPGLKSRTIQCFDIAGFKMNIRYAESDPTAPENQYDSHIHTECEIYIHISGDAHFMVENNIYPVLPGSVIITRPYEYHHCIYRSSAINKHFCIFFTADRNEELLSLFFNRKAGMGNLLTLSFTDTDKVLSLCHEMIDKVSSPFMESYRFMRLLYFLHQAEICEPYQNVHQDVLTALSEIDNNLAEKLSIVDLARKSNVSINTLERHFREHLNMSPTSYIKQKRLARAMQLLASGNNVTEVCEKCGFGNSSAFIAQFRRVYGKTPFQYKKELTSK